MKAELVIVYVLLMFLLYYVLIYRKTEKICNCPPATAAEPGPDRENLLNQVYTKLGFIS